MNTINKNIRLKLKGKLAFMLLSLFVTQVLLGQDLLWKSNFGGLKNNVPIKSAIDINDNIYVGGYFDSTIYQPTGIMTNGGTDGFITKYTATGNVSWTRKIGGTSVDQVTGMVVTPDGEYVYVIGVFQGTAYAEGQPMVSAGSNDGFLAKYRSNGDLVWCKRNVYAAGNQRPNSIKVDKNNNLVIAGWFFSQVNLGNATFNIPLTTTQALGMFVAKFDTSGTVLSAQKIESSNSSSRLYTIDVDTSGYYITGYYKGSLMTSIDTISSNSGSQDMFAYKLDHNLNGKWLIKIGGILDDYLTSCSTDDLGYFYLGGQFSSSTMSVDSTALGVPSVRLAINKTLDNKSDIFFAKYRYDGQLQWFNTAGSKGDDKLYRALYKNGNFIAAGQYGDTLSFNNKTIIPKGNGDAFAIVQNQNDNLVYLLPFTGSGVETGETAVVDNNGNFVVIGDYTSSKIFITNKDSLVNSETNNTKDMFVAKFDKGSLSHTIVPITCTGASTGSIILTPEGTLVPPFTYSWTKIGEPTFTRSTKDISGLSAGSYRISFTDKLLYNKIDTITLVDPSGISVSLDSISDVSCFNGLNGRIYIAASGGTGTLSYAWTTTGGTGLNATAEDQIALSSGIYHVSVSDINNCSATLNGITISQPQRITFHNTIVTKINGAMGSIDLSVQGGTQPYRYNWTGPLAFSDTTQDISNIINAGDYKVDITDGNLCHSDTTMLIADSHVLNASISAKLDVLCKGKSTGSVTVKADNPVGNVSYLWSNGGITPTISNLAAGDYSVTVTDEFPTSVIVNVTINEPASLFTVSVARTNITCNNLNNGILDANPSGGTLPFTYVWTKEAQPFNGNNETLTGLSEGSYSVTVTDVNGCDANAGNNIIRPLPITFKGTVKDVTCEDNKNDGSITLSEFQGGTGSFTYQWNNGSTEQNLTLLPIGNYSVTVSDVNNCQAYNNFVVGNEAPILITITPTDVTCFGSANGILNATVSGGHPGFTYQWSNAGNTSQISNLQPGTYTVTVTDNKLCTKTQSGVISQPSTLAIGSFNQVNVSCFGGNNGSVSLNVTGGTPVYSYSWDQGAGTNYVVNNLPAGTYNVTVTDAKSCTTSGSYTITEPQALGLSENISAHSNVLCYGGTDGSITLLPAGGSGTYQYSINNGPWGTSPTFDNLSMGDYNFRLRDANAITCLYNWPQTVNIFQPSVLSIESFNQVNVSCNGGNNGSITLNVTGGTPIYAYSWDNGAGSSSSVTGLIAGTYNVTVTDSHNCTSNGNYSITQPTALTLSEVTGHTDVLCNGASTGTLSVVASGGTTPYTYTLNLNGTATGNTTGAADGNFNSIPAGANYTVVVTDVNDCPSSPTIQVTINEPAPLSVLSITKTDATIKDPSYNGSINVVAQGGTSPYTYTLGVLPSQTTGVFENLAPAKYAVVITDINNCGPIKSDSVLIEDFTGITSIELGRIKIFPNPSFGNVNFGFENVKALDNISLEIIDLSGKVIYTDIITVASIQSGRYSIDLKGNAKGVYLIRLDGKILKSKIILK